MESKGTRVNMNKTKVMISGERQMVRQKDVRWPCGICSKENSGLPCHGNCCMMMTWQ